MLAKSAAARQGLGFSISGAKRASRFKGQVKLEDAVAAEDIFTTLRGENVEARRKSIEDNALQVVNLDI